MRTFDNALAFTKSIIRFDNTPSDSLGNATLEQMLPTSGKSYPSST